MRDLLNVDLLRRILTRLRRIYIRPVDFIHERRTGASARNGPIQARRAATPSHLGLDSLMAGRLKNRISVDLKVNVPAVRFLHGFSVEEVVIQVPPATDTRG